VLKPAPPNRSRPARAGACLYLTLLLGPAPLAAADPGSAPAAGSSVYQTQSDMLYNVAKFIDWPAGALSEAGALVVGVMGDDPFGAHLDTALRNKTVSGHPVVVRRLDSPARLNECHVLFVGASGSRQAAGILRALGRAPVLTVGEGERFARLGGIVAFIRDGGRMRLEINLDAAERARLHVSSKLLRVATVRRTAARRPGD